ncbi:hypothetical protein Lal_00021485 [Lupinus albus]|nr:hypothetical protein Lal_00021485 [Lupinus albus]
MLSGTKCYAVKYKQENELDAAENVERTRQNKIRNECTRMKVCLAPILKNMVESRYRWFEHVRIRS